MGRRLENESKIFLSFRFISGSGIQNELLEGPIVFFPDKAADHHHLLLKCGNILPVVNIVDNYDSSTHSRPFVLQFVEDLHI